MSEPRSEKDSSSKSGELELRADEEEWLRVHEEATHVQTELELKRLEAEEEIARLARQLEEARLKKAEELENLRAREEILRAREREVAQRARQREQAASWAPERDAPPPRRRSAPRTTRASYASSSTGRDPSYGSSSRDVVTNVPSRVVDEAARFWRSLAMAYVHQFRVAADAAAAVADSVQERAEGTNGSELDTSTRVPTGRRRSGFEGASTLTGDIVGGFWEGVDRALDLPREGVERFYDSYSRRD
jgi:hypothetical protein